MITRWSFGNDPYLLFTLDFGRTTRGHFMPGAKCSILYAPGRIVPENELNQLRYLTNPVMGHLRFKESAVVADLPLITRSADPRLLDNETDIDGAVCRGSFEIPTDAEFVEAWFSYVDGSGFARFDSAYGKNYMFRFRSLDIEVLDAEVVPLVNQDRFACQVATSSAVSGVHVGLRITNNPADRDQRIVALVATTMPSKDGRTLWETQDVYVPSKSVVAFELNYTVNGQLIRDTNQGAYYIAVEQPEMNVRAGRRVVLQDDRFQRNRTDVQIPYDRTLKI